MKQEEGTVWIDIHGIIHIIKNAGPEDCVTENNWLEEARA